MRTALVIIAAILVLSLGVFVACGPSGEEVTREELGDDWPLTVDSAWVWCQSDQTILMRADGHTYGLNGPAQDAGYPSPDPIWRDDPNMPDGVDAKISLRPLINRGMELCDG
jgi:hypothetical protein